MFLSRHDLSQMNDEYLASLDIDVLRGVSCRLLSDLKEAQDRLNQNPQNSSRPSGSMPAYLGSPMVTDQTGEASNDEEDDDDDNDEDDKVVSKRRKPRVDQDKGQGTSVDDFEGPSGPEGAQDAVKGNKPSDKGTNAVPAPRHGKPVGAQGYGRTQVIPPRSVETHRAEQCAACGVRLPPDAPFVARTGFHVVDIEDNDASSQGIRVFCVLHHYGETECDCGHQTLLMPGRGDHHVAADGRVNTTLSEWRLIGPNLASFIVFLTFRMRLSRARTKEFLHVWCGLRVATGTIDNCVRESALACLPVYLQLMVLVRQEQLVNVDETPWKENRLVPWLWVFASPTITFL